MMSASNTDTPSVNASHRDNRIRVLQVIDSMGIGGVETWLMHVLRNLDRSRFDMDIVVHTTEEHSYDREIRALGSKVIPCPHPYSPWSYGRRFAEIVREHGPYDVVHNQAYHFSGYISFREARRAGTPICVVHSHVDGAPVKGTVARQLYSHFTNRLVNRLATARIAVSREAGEFLFNGNRRPRPWRTLYCGIDLDAFRATTTPGDVRRELGIPPDSFVIGHVGRFTRQKNHEFLIDIAATVSARVPNTQLLLIGDGPLRKDIQRKVENLRMQHRVKFLGSRHDVARLMLNAIDVFVLPSRFEGLPLVLLEAQAAGLPCVCSNIISGEADIVKPLIHRLAITESVNSWAETIVAIREQPRATSRNAAICEMMRSPFNISNAVKELEQFYIAAVTNA